MRYDKIHSALKLKNDDGTYKLLICEECPNLINELDSAVYSDENIGKINSGSLDHAIDDLGLFLVYYSDDICHLGFDELKVKNRSRLQRLLEDEEKYLLENVDYQDYCIANDEEIW